MRKILSVFKSLAFLFFVVWATSIFSMEHQAWTPQERERREQEAARGLLLLKANLRDNIPEAWNYIDRLKRNIQELERGVPDSDRALQLIEKGEIEGFLEQIAMMDSSLGNFQDWLSSWLPLGLEATKVDVPSFGEEFFIGLELNRILQTFNTLRGSWEEVKRNIFFNVEIARNVDELKRNVIALVQHEDFCPVYPGFDIHLVGFNKWRSLYAARPALYEKYGVPFLQTHAGQLGKYLRGAEDVPVLKVFYTEGEARRAIFYYPAILNLYKIHLMPKDEQFLQFLQSFLQAIKQDMILQENITEIKIKPVTEQYVAKRLIEGPFLQLPKIVVYISGGKDAAQAVLNKIYDLFKNWEGVDRTPRYNEKATSLIYFAQGNAEDKQKFPNFYTSDGVYFKSNVTGQVRDYTLVNPARVAPRLILPREPAVRPTTLLRRFRATPARRVRPILPREPAVWPPTPARRVRPIRPRERIRHKGSRV